MHSLPIYISPTRVVHVLQLMKLGGHTIISQSPQFTLVFTLGTGQFLYSFVFIFYFFTIWPCPVACGVLVPWQGIEPMPLALKCRVLTTGPPVVKEFPIPVCFLTSKGYSMATAKLCSEGAGDLRYKLLCSPTAGSHRMHLFPGLRPPFTCVPRSPKLTHGGDHLEWADSVGIF